MPPLTCAQEVLIQFGYNPQILNFLHNSSHFYWLSLVKAFMNENVEKASKDGYILVNKIQNFLHICYFVICNRINFYPILHLCLPLPLAARYARPIAARIPAANENTPTASTAVSDRYSSIFYRFCPAWKPFFFASLSVCDA